MANSTCEPVRTFIASPTVNIESALPYRIATLLYCFDEQDRILLLQRAHEPNKGFWSPCGGKLRIAVGESPYACACREAHEEMLVDLTPSDLHLTGIVSEHGYQGNCHWLMFLFEVKPRFTRLPPPHAEGNFAFFTRDQLETLHIPRTDKEQIYPLFWKHRGAFFAAHCHCLKSGQDLWTLEESVIIPERHDA